MTMQWSTVALVFLSAARGVQAAHMRGANAHGTHERTVSRGSHARLAGLLHSGMRPEVVAESFAAVEDEWRAQARSYVECTSSNGTDCSGSPKAFQKSCALVSKAMVGGSSGNNAVVTEYMSYVCNSTKLEGWKKEGCVSFAAAVDKIMSGDNYYNRHQLNVTSLCGTFWAKFSADEKEREAAERAAFEAEQKQREAEAAEAAKVAADAAAKAAEEQKKADEAKKAEEQKKAQEAAKKAAEESAKKAEEAKAELEKRKEEAARMAEEAQKRKEEAEKAAEEHAKMANRTIAAKASTNASITKINVTVASKNASAAVAPQPKVTPVKAEEKNAAVKKQ